MEIRHKKRLNQTNIFCNRKCESEFRKLNNPHYIRCANCDRLMYKKPYEQNKSKTKMLCCSTQCMGELRKAIYKGENNPNFNNRGANSPLHKKDERITKPGYRLIFVGDEHPFAIYKYWIREHRYIAEKYLMKDEHSITIDGKKYLNPIYDVHHKDFNRLNNSVDNLQILSRSDHMKLHQELKREFNINTVDKAV